MPTRMTQQAIPIAELQQLRKDRQFIGSLARGLQILSCFRVDSPLLSNAEIARRCLLPKSTVSRFTYTLTKIDCLEFDGRFSKYRLGPRVLSLGHTMLAGFDVRAHMLPYMQRLAEFANCVVTLAICEDFSMVAVDDVRSASTLLPPLEPGTHISIATSSMGRAYLASASRSERDRILNHLAKTKPGSWHTIEKDLEKTFKEYRKVGFCTAIDDWRKGMNAVAVPLYLKNFGRRVVLSCGGPASQLSSDSIHKRVGARLLRVANEIETSFEKTLAYSR
jgi:DNA-binding IclR family transcriptional regulator